MLSNKKQMFMIIGIFALILTLTTVTYSFFNYTRTGAINNLGTGRIYFNSTQGNTLNIILSPNGIKNEILNNENLENGSKIIIKVTDDLGNYEYTINILKDNETLINIICYSVFGIGVGSLVSSIIYVINKKKIYK